MAKKHSSKGFFEGKKITQMGLGLLGRGLGVAEFLAEQGAELIVTDLKSREELKSSVEVLARFPNIRFVLGEHRLEDFRGRDMIIKGPKVALNSPYIAEAKRQRTPVEMDASLFAKLSKATIVGITGTRGKSTTTHLLYQILKKAKKRVYLGGNIKGIATLPLLRKLRRGDLVVMELDSWQLQGFGEAKLSPQVAVFTTFMPDHLDYYGTLKKYFDDKANIFRYQKPKDFFIAGRQVSPRLEKGMSRGRLIIIDPDDFPKDWKLKIPGEHNRYNAALAIAGARVLKIRESTIKKAVESFRGIEGRLELMRNLKGIRIYNDTTATTPEATIAGLRAFTPPQIPGRRRDETPRKKNIILIMGGYDKGLDMSELLKEIPRHCKKVLLLAGTGTDRIKKNLQYDSIYGSMAEAVGAAFSGARRGDIILFSPAFASFGMFKNEYDRGEQFNKVVKSL